MDDNGENLTPEEEALKKQFAEEDENTPGIEGDLPLYVAIPKASDGVLAEFIKKVK